MTTTAFTDGGNIKFRINANADFTTAGILLISNFCSLNASTWVVINISETDFGPFMNNTPLPIKNVYARSFAPGSTLPEPDGPLTAADDRSPYFYKYDTKYVRICTLSQDGFNRF